jgi:hypothetical protein
MTESKFDGKEALIIPVISAEKDEPEIELMLVKEGDVLEIRLKGQKLCDGDWTGNFKKLFEEALRKWGKIT